MDTSARRKLVAGTCIIILFLILLIGEAMRDRTLRRWALAWFAVALSAFGAVMVLLVLLFGYGASAHDHAKPQLNEWFLSLKSHNGIPCCDYSEAIHINDPDWESQNKEDSHFRVKLNDVWIDVPDSAVIDGPNLEGPAMVWPVGSQEDGIWIRCFMPGTMG